MKNEHGGFKRNFPESGWLSGVFFLGMNVELLEGPFVGDSLYTFGVLFDPLVIVHAGIGNRSGHFTKEGGNVILGDNGDLSTHNRMFRIVASIQTNLESRNNLSVYFAKESGKTDSGRLMGSARIAATGEVYLRERIKRKISFFSQGGYTICQQLLGIAQTDLAGLRSNATNS